LPSSASTRSDHHYAAEWRPNCAAIFVNCSNAASKSSAISVAKISRRRQCIGVGQALVLNPEEIEAELVTLQKLEPESELFTEAQTDAIAYVIVELRKQWREERDEAIAPLKAEIAELKGKVDALLTLLQGAKAKVIALPRKRPSDAA